MGTRRQMGKGYERHLRYKQQDRDKHTYQKAKKKGLRGMVEEVQQLKEEVATLENARRVDNKVIHDQRAHISYLENQLHRSYVWRGLAMLTIGVLSCLLLYYMP